MKLLTTLFLAMILFVGVSASAFGDRVNNVRDLDTNGNGIYEPGEVDPCKEYQSGPCVCYCPVTRFKTENYCVTRCVEEPYTVDRKCCRWVDQPYCVKKCRYVPQYYTQT